MMIEQQPLPSILRAVANDDIAALQRLITPSNIDVQQMAWTPLCRCIRSKRHDMVAWLINEGADVNHTDTGGYTPLLAALRMGNVAVTKTLLRAGASVAPIQVKTNVADHVQHDECIRLVIRHGARFGKNAPDWVKEYEAQIEQVRAATVALLGICRLRRQAVTRGQDPRLVVEIAKLMWGMR